MELVEELFAGALPADYKIGYLEEGNLGPLDQVQQLSHLFQIIHDIYSVSHEDLFLDRGILAKGTADFLSAEIVSLSPEGETRYVYFNNPGQGFAILSKITERACSYSELFVNSIGSDSTKSAFLRENQLISKEGDFVEATYSAVLVGGEWFIRSEEKINSNPLGILDEEIVDLRKFSLNE